jgi:hypothetical protein
MQRAGRIQNNSRTASAAQPWFISVAQQDRDSREINDVASWCVLLTSLHLSALANKAGRAGSGQSLQRASELCWREKKKKTQNNVKKNMYDTLCT